MEDLFKKVCKGKYPQISPSFSFELRRVLSLMLQVKPQRRPSADELLNLKEVKDKIDELYIDELKSDNSTLSAKNLLGTIIVPEEIKDLSGKLPKSNYKSDNSEEVHKFLNSPFMPSEIPRKPESTKASRLRRSNSRKKIMKEVFSYGIEKSKSKESSRKGKRQRSFFI